MSTLEEAVKMEMVDQIKERMQQKSDDELLAVWTKKDKTEWSEDAFEAVRQILTDRNVKLPELPREDVAPAPSRSLKANRKTTEESTCAKCGASFQLAEDLVECGCCGRLQHKRCWDETGACTQEECRVELRACPSCGKPIKAVALKCRYCGSYLDAALKQAMEPMDEDLRHYVYDAQGIGRVGLNVMSGIGIFIFGWLLALAFGQLGKGKTGWVYVAPVIILLIAGRNTDSPVVVLAPILYLIGWVHANLVLSGYKRSAKQRLIAIEDRAEYETDAALEKGILLNKVLRQPEVAVAILCKAATLPGGDPALLNLAGVQLNSMGRYSEAAVLFQRVVDGAADSELIKLATANLKAAQKKLS